MKHVKKGRIIIKQIIRNFTYIIIGLLAIIIYSNLNSADAESHATKAEAIYHMNTLEGKGWDYDDEYGWQCFDLVNEQWDYLYGHGLEGDYAKDIPDENNFDGEATVYKNSDNFQAEAGDIVVFNEEYGSGAGHTAIVTDGNYGGNEEKFESLDQNWNGGGAEKEEVAQRVVHEYETEMWFIRPHYKQ